MPGRTSYEPGTFCWADPMAPDPETATAFCTALFRWKGDTGPALYAEWRTPGGTPAGWMTRMDERWPAETPPRWTAAFTVSGCDAVATRAAELGGTVTVAPRDIPAGRFALLEGPQGGRFPVIQPNR